MESLRISRLTDRQRSCLRLVHAHLSSKEIATRLGIGPGTVDQHIKAAMLILGVCDRREAAQMLVNHEAAMSERPVEAPAETARGIASPTNIVVDEVLASIRHGLRNVLNFSGRDTRAQFRIYAIFLFAIGVASTLFIVQTRFAIMFMRWQQLAATHPEQAGSVFQLRRNHPELLPNFADLPFILVLIAFLHLTLIAAAVARRRHDWTWTELWGSIALAVANIAIVMKPAMLLPVLPLATESVLVYAFARGGAPERIAVAAVAAGTALLFFAFWINPFRAGAHVSIFVIDSVGLLVFLVLALRANRFWPIWIVATYCVGLAAHLIALTNPMVEPVAYGVIAMLMAPFFLLVLLVGTHNHQLRLRQNGVDPAWTPLGRPRRRAMRLSPREEKQGIGANCIGA